MEARRPEGIVEKEVRKKALNLFMGDREEREDSMWLYQSIFQTTTIVEDYVSLLTAEDWN